MHGQTCCNSVLLECWNVRVAHAKLCQVGCRGTLQLTLPLNRREQRETENTKDGSWDQEEEGKVTRSPSS